MANTLTVDQMSQAANAILSQATGQANMGNITTGNFVTVAQTALVNGYDPILNSISQVLTRTIFSIRPYDRKLSSLQVTNEQWGNHVRKLQSADRQFIDDAAYDLEEGKSVDMYKVTKEPVLQTNYYGQQAFTRDVTVYDYQLDVAMQSLYEFTQFWTMIMTNIRNQIEQAHEGIARMTINNLIAGKTLCDSRNVLHLVQLYNADTGSSLTKATVKSPDNFGNFAQWLYGFLDTLVQYLTERTVIYHANIANYNGKAIPPIPRHTPLHLQKIYLNTATVNNINTRVLSQIFHTDRLKIATTEKVNFWQSLSAPTSMLVTPAYLDTQTGGIKVAEEAVALTDVLGVIMDTEAAGYTVIRNRNSVTPYNSAGGYYKMYWKFADRWWNDFTENAIVLCLD